MDYGTWTGNVTPGPSFLTMAGTADQYGGGGFFFAPIDVTGTPPANTYLVISIRRLPSHDLGNVIQLSLLNANGSLASWDIAASAINLSPTAFTTVIIPLFTTPSFLSLIGGDTTVTDIFDDVANFYVQGNFFGTSAPFAVEIESMAIIPEPTPALLIVSAAMLLGIGIALYRKKSQRAAASR